ncbi:MAG: hypothetical protein JOY79_04710 [Acidobacteriaceae bacterium]|nr:hypothetical protein [Acidobacteriaceae bacterium]
MALAAALVGSFVSAAAQQSPAPVSTQTPRTQTHRAKRAKPAPAAAPVVASPPVPVYTPPPTPENMPAKAPQVSYAGGMLTIVAENSTLGDILNAVKARTGASIDSPGPMGERVATRLGPAPPRQVLADLLKGSHYDYVMVGSDADPQGIRSIILTRNASSPAAGSGTATAAGGTPQPGGRGVNEMLRRMRGGPAPAQPPADDSAAEPEEQQAEETPPVAQQQQPQVMPPHAVGQGPQAAQPDGQFSQPQPPDANAQSGQTEQRVRTPEELPQDLQRLQQQQQQQQPQTHGQQQEQEQQQQ